MSNKSVDNIIDALTKYKKSNLSLQSNIHTDIPDMRNIDIVDESVEQDLIHDVYNFIENIYGSSELKRFKNLIGPDLRDTILRDIYKHRDKEFIVKDINQLLKMISYKDVRFDKKLFTVDDICVNIEEEVDTGNIIDLVKNEFKNIKWREVDKRGSIVGNIFKNNEASISILVIPFEEGKSDIFVKFSNGKVCTDGRPWEETGYLIGNTFTNKKVLSTVSKIIRDSSKKDYKYDRVTISANFRDKWGLTEVRTHEIGFYNQLFGKVNEDTVKNADGTYSNVGDTGESHGKFKSKKKADAQRKAIFANGWKQ